MHWDSIVARKIEAAQAEGVFDDLPGQGRPLKLYRNPYIAKDMRISFDVLQNAGFAPRWIELDREIRDRLKLARKDLALGFDPDETGSKASVHALHNFTAAIEEINVMIQALNLLVPSDRFTRVLIDASSEVARIQNTWWNAGS